MSLQCPFEILGDLEGVGAGWFGQGFEQRPHARAQVMARVGAATVAEKRVDLPDQIGERERAG